MVLPGTLLYRFSLAAYRLGATISSLWNPKATKWVQGQKLAKDTLKDLSISRKSIWVHCASLGEYEQARPIIDALKAQYPLYHLVLTFFSPSGYEAVKPRIQDATVLYLPLDSEDNAGIFLNAIQPSLAIFIKYEHWHYYLTALKERNVPSLLVSAIFRASQPFFKWYGSFFRNMLRQYTQILVQDGESLDLLKSIGITSATVIGDTRFDRVLAIKEQQETLPIIEQFKGTDRLLIAGSTWPKDDELLVKFINQNHHLLPDVRYIIVPHETNLQHIGQLAAQLKTPAVTYTQFERNPSAKVMIIDTIGVLSRSYRYADAAYIGGGFGIGIHNTLEAAVHGIPVVFGPNYLKFREAVEMAAINAAFPIHNYGELEQTFLSLLNNPENKAGMVAQQYVAEKSKATAKVMHVVNQQLLT